MDTNIVTSTEPISISYASYQLTFSNIELIRDQHAVVLRCDVQNNGKYDECISSNSFILSSNQREVQPNVSYISDSLRQSTLWAWKTIKPNASCTIIMKFQLEPDLPSYELKFNYHKIKHLLKRFQVNNHN